MALVECLARCQKTARQEPPAETTRPDHAVQANCVLRGLHAALRGLHAGARKWRAASAVFDASAWHAAGQRNALPAGGITRVRRWVRRDTGGVFVVPDALSGRAGNRRGSRSRGNRPTRETPGTLPARCGSIPGFPGWACCATNRSGGDAQRFAKPRPSRPRSWHGACHRCPCDAASFDRRVPRSADPPVRAPLPGADLAVQRQAPLATLAPAQPGFRPTLPPPDRPHRPDAGQRLRRRLHSGLAPGGGPGGRSRGATPVRRISRRRLRLPSCARWPRVSTGWPGRGRGGAWASACEVTGWRCPRPAPRKRDRLPRWPRRRPPETRRRLTWINALQAAKVAVCARNVVTQIRRRRGWQICRLK